jgi:hypothetical protein
MTPATSARSASSLRVPPTGKHRAFPRLRPWLAAAALGLFPAQLACSGEKAQPEGALMLVFSTDMQVPKDFDEVSVRVVPKDTDTHVETVRTFSYSAVPSAPGMCNVSGANGATLRFPATLPVTRAHQRRGDVTIEITARRAGEAEPPVFERIIDTTVPEHEIRMLRVPIEWMCSTEVRADSCGANRVDSSLLPEYDSERTPA